MNKIVFPKTTTEDVEKYGKTLYKTVKERYIDKINDAHVRFARSTRLRLIVSSVWFGVSMVALIFGTFLKKDSDLWSTVSLLSLAIGGAGFALLLNGGNKWRNKRISLEDELKKELVNWDIDCGWYEKEEAFIPNKQFYECLKSLESVRDDDEFKFDVYNGEIRIQSFINGFKHSDFKIDLSENQSSIRMIVNSEGVCDFTYLDDWYNAYDKRMGEWKML